jgi:hypothetical protein
VAAEGERAGVRSTRRQRHQIFVWIGTRTKGRVPAVDHPLTTTSVALDAGASNPGSVTRAWSRSRSNNSLLHFGPAHRLLIRVVAEFGESAALIAGWALHVPVRLDALL